MGYLGSNKVFSVLFLSITVGCGALSQAGFNINHIDIAPQYAGVLMGITNTAGTISGILGPLVAKTIAHRVWFDCLSLTMPYRPGFPMSRKGNT